MSKEMDMTTTASTEELFEQAVADKIATMKSLGYTPSLFIRMIRQQGAVAATKTLMASGSSVQAGLTKLVLMGRRDLTMEQLIQRPEFRDLFTPLERQEAARRLR